VGGHFVHVVSAGSLQPATNRKIEDIIEAMTGWSDADIVEGMSLEDEMDDPSSSGRAQDAIHWKPVQDVQRW
jgi:hypothetical protein